MNFLIILHCNEEMQEKLYMFVYSEYLNNIRDPLAVCVSPDKKNQQKRKRTLR